MSIESEMEPSSSSEKKIRLRLNVTLDGGTGGILETPITISVHQLKLAVKIQQGLDVYDQKLALLRGDEIVRLEDTRNLNFYRLDDGDQLVVLPVMRTGPGPDVYHRKSAADQSADEEKVSYDESMDNSQTVSIQSETIVSEEIHQTPRSSMDDVSNEKTKEKVAELKAKLERCRRESPAMASTYSSISSESVFPDRSICDHCSSPAMSNGNGSCQKCGGQFCANHLIRMRHSCTATHRCSICDDLVLIAGDRYKCHHCQRTLCPRHLKVQCSDDHHNSQQDDPKPT